MSAYVELAPSIGAPIETAEAALAFILAGNARVTLVSRRTETRFSYRVRTSEDQVVGVHFVQLLVGSSNETDYAFLGTIFDGTRYRHGHKSRFALNAPGAVAFAWAFRHLAAGHMPESLGVWHEGRCGRCSRALTVPSSIAAGLGPECAGRLM